MNLRVISWTFFPLKVDPVLHIDLTCNSQALEVTWLNKVGRMKITIKPLPNLDNSGTSKLLLPSSHRGLFHLQKKSWISITSLPAGKDWECPASAKWKYCKTCCDELPKPGEVPEKWCRVSQSIKVFSISKKNNKRHLSFQTPGDILRGRKEMAFVEILEIGFCCGRDAVLVPKKNCLPKMVGDIRVLPLTFEKKTLFIYASQKLPPKHALCIPQQNSTHQEYQGAIHG